MKVERGCLLANELPLHIVVELFQREAWTTLPSSERLYGFKANENGQLVRRLNQQKSNLQTQHRARH